MIIDPKGMTLYGVGIAPEIVTIQQYAQSTRIVHFQVKRFSHVSLLAGRECVVPIEPIPV